MRNTTKINGTLIKKIRGSQLDVRVRLIKESRLDSCFFWNIIMELYPTNLNSECKCIAWRNKFLLPLEFVTWFGPDDACVRVIIYLCHFAGYLLFSEKMYVLWLLPSQNTSKPIIDFILYVTDDHRMSFPVKSLLLLLQLHQCAGKLIEIFIVLLIFI